MKEYTFDTEAGNITAQVTPTIEALGDQPWRVVLLGQDGKQLVSRLLESSSALGAATDAVDEYLEEREYNTSFAVSL